MLDGNPQAPPRFRQSGGGNAARYARASAQVQSFDYRPASGAGTTGFNSTNVPKRKGKDRDQDGQAQGTARQPAKPAGAATGSAPAAGRHAPKTDGTAKADATAQTDPLALTPEQLQPAAAPLDPRLRRRIVRARRRSTPARSSPPLRPRRRAGGRRRRTSRSLRSASRSAPSSARPALEYSRGYDNNVPRNSAPPAASSSFVIVAPELLINSDWSRHELTASLRGSYTAYDTTPELTGRPSTARSTGASTSTAQTRIDLEGRYLLFTDNPGSPNIQADLARLPIFTTLGSTVGVGQRFNRFEVSAQGHLPTAPSTRLRDSTDGHDRRATPTATTTVSARSCAPATS